MSLIASTAIERLVSMLEDADRQPRECYGGWQALCPAHDDRSPSLSVREGDDGRALVHCFAGCDPQAIVSALGLELSDLFDGARSRPAWSTPPRRDRRIRDALPDPEQLLAWEQQLHSTAAALELAHSAKRWSAAALSALDVGWDGRRFTIPIRNNVGELVNVCRYLPAGRPKMLTAKGWPRDLFPAPESVRGVLSAGGREQHEPVYVVEGEPDAISAIGAGLYAVAIPGSDCWQSTWAGRFGGLHVRVLTDHDDPGRRLAEVVAHDLAAHAASLCVLRWPDVIGREPSEGYDVGDWLLEHPTESCAA